MKSMIQKAKLKLQRKGNNEVLELRDLLVTIDLSMMVHKSMDDSVISHTVNQWKKHRPEIEEVTQHWINKLRHSQSELKEVVQELRSEVLETVI